MITPVLHIYRLAYFHVFAREYIYIYIYMYIFIYVYVPHMWTKKSRLLVKNMEGAFSANSCKIAHAARRWWGTSSRNHSNDLYTYIDIYYMSIWINKELYAYKHLSSSFSTYSTCDEITLNLATCPKAPAMISMRSKSLFVSKALEIQPAKEMIFFSVAEEVQSVSSWRAYWPKCTET